MKTPCGFRLILSILLAAAADAAYAQQPPDVVMSDADFNTAMGTDALLEHTTSTYNTAAGFDVLLSNTNGFDNTATGALALANNTSGYQNSAFGVSALQANSTGINNTAVGGFALYSNSAAFDNSAFGYGALYSNTTSNYNSASGYFALFSNGSGQQNTGSGVYALYNNTSGSYNTAAGVDALYKNSKGSFNIAEGYKAGFNLTTGSNNINIGNQGVAGDGSTIRIGTKSTQTATYIAGIYGASVTGNAVFVSSDGQLGVKVSSERFKTAIAPMGSDSQKLQQLRPVTFHLKTDPHGSVQYGLIAEEVAKVYPELVIRDDSGRIDGVRYDELAPMLLNEVQQQKRKITAQDEQNALQAAAIRGLMQRQKQLDIQEVQLGDVQRQLALMRATLAKLDGQ